ncbi:hypothetical protein [Edaphobacter dinghuensis]|uniref:Uncharacterized protein n=1 Tax=Edaphobacter dinghuensis TaxID=1560005 RepID=A0A917MB61_9BACT|nr:hypothetical protein [Edaphobacter dinghuensis]GGG89075.1 hypothetical protein GCM10011585_36550 [Edaphobacter dinghuensis]
MSTLHEQPVLHVGDPEAFGAVKGAIESSFSLGHVAAFLKTLERSGVRVRDFQSVLAKGLLGKATATQYGQLGNSDQGQIRELYLASLERVAPELRQKFFKLYAYY